MVPSNLFERVYRVDPATVTMPADLLKWADRLKCARRFAARTIYSPGIICCNNLVHTIRMLLFLRAILTDEELQYALAIAIIHDVPESDDKEDLTLVEGRRDPERSRQKREKEWEFALARLSDRERQLFDEYRTASAFVRKEVESCQVSRVAMIVKVVDSIEGMAMLHRSLTEFMKGPEYDRERMPTEEVLLMGLEDCHELRYRLALARHPATALCCELLDEVLAYLRQLWLGCPADRVPKFIAEHFGLERCA